MTIEHQNETLLDMDQVKVDPKWALRIPGNLALRRKLLPFTQQGEHVLVACADPADVQGLQAIERYVAAPVQPNVADPESLERAINRIFRESLSGNNATSAPTRVTFNDVNKVDPEGEDIVALGDEIFHAALIRSATDIHIEPGHSDVRIRFRVDGMLEEYRRIPMPILGPLISRLKVLAGMDIAERRAPQDGRFTIAEDTAQATDVRVATIPTKQGERMTLRLLATQTDELTLEKLGMLPAELQVFERAIEMPNGLILLTGPTGCGKSTTLYAAIRRMINSRSLNIITVEDPVEYVIDGITQIEVDTADKVNFHKALRSGLRHDPDVMMIGEIRDEITAEIAIKAALTGHLVFATLHTNSALSSITRLIDMKVQPFLVGAVSRLYVAQRLVRRICEHCRVESELDASHAEMIGRPEMAGMSLFEPGGCKYCAGTGFVGRTGLFEVLPFDGEISRLVATGSSESQVAEYTTQQNHGLLIDDALNKLQSGITTFSEVISVVNHL